jgi:hypothetical protein
VLLELRLKGSAINGRIFRRLRAGEGLADLQSVQAYQNPVCEVTVCDFTFK